MLLTCDRGYDKTKYQQKVIRTDFTVTKRHSYSNPISSIARITHLIIHRYDEIVGVSLADPYSIVSITSIVIRPITCKNTR